MFDNTNPYTLRTKIVDEVTHYFIRFEDGQANSQKIEITPELFSEFVKFKKQDKRHQNFFDRHIEHSQLTEISLTMRALHPHKNVEQIVCEEERSSALKQAIAELPKVQRRRFILYYEHGLTYEKIAEVEDCTFWQTSNLRSTELSRKSAYPEVNSKIFTNKV